MNATNITRALLCSARKIAQEEFDVPSTEAILAIFYRLCIEHDRQMEREEEFDGSNDCDSVH